MQLSDILPPVLPAQSATSVWLVAGTVILGLMLLTVLRRRAKPLQAILKQLKNGQLTPREAAHALAQQQPSRALDQLRFQREEPTAQQVLRLIKSEGRHE